MKTESKTILVNYLGRNGAGPIFAYEMTKGLLEHGCRVYAILSDAISNLKDWECLPLENLVTVHTYSNKFNFITATVRFHIVDLKRLKKIFQNVKFNACYMPMGHFWDKPINKIFKQTKTIYTLHDPLPHSGSSKLLYHLSRKKISSYDEIVILSGCFKETVSKYFNHSPEHIHVIPHGIFDYYDRFSFKPTERTGEYNFLFLGRIEKYKGLHLLSQAYHRLFSERKDISLYIVGKGDFTEYQAEFLTGTPDCGGENVTVVNRFIDDNEVASYFEGKNIITVLPYIDATQSGVVPIAMQHESLLIVTNTGGLAEQTGYGKYAVVAQTNADSLYECMKLAVEQYASFKPKIKEAKKYIESLSWNHLSELLLDIV